MIVKALVENTSVSEDLGCEHGLSLYIETEKHKILV
jgi:7,8-dihydropterin-6-yl-methyl-4-(beta-D-ribofuranosyl)aminobenzene 5'-phosphate synthase